MEKTTDEKIVELVAHALKMQDARLLFGLSRLLEMRGSFAAKLDEMLGEDKVTD